MEFVDPITGPEVCSHHFLKKYAVVKIAINSGKFYGLCYTESQVSQTVVPSGLIIYESLVILGRTVLEECRGCKSGSRTKLEEGSLK